MVSLTIVSVILSAILTIYWYLTKTYDHWKRLGVNGPKPIVVFGNFLHRCVRPLAVIDVGYLKKYGTIIGVYDGRNPVLLVAEPEIIKQITVKDFQAFADRRSLTTEHPIINKALFLNTGDDWKRLRTIMSPTFTSGKMRRMYHLVRECVREMCDHLDVIAGGQPINIRPVHQCFALDVIASCAFATKINAQSEPNSEFVVNGRRAMDFNVWQMIPSFVFPKWLNRALGVRTQFVEEPSEYMFTMARHILANRRRQTGVGKEYHDFIQLLIDANARHTNNNNKSIDLSDDEEEVVETQQKLYFGTKTMTEEEIIAQSWLFLLAGFESTATTMAYLSYELARNPDVQQRLYEEVVEAMDSEGEIDYDRLHGLPYLDAVFSESMRLYPVATRLEREAGQPVVLKTSSGADIPIFKGQLVEIPVHAIHRSERYYPNPNQFDPDRFLPQNKHLIAPYTYLPFGTGPRNCIGNRFAIMEVKLCIAHLVKRFRFTTTAQTESKLLYVNLSPALVAKSVTIGIEKR